MLSGSPTTRWYLIALADAISHGTGFLTVATILSEQASDPERVKGLRASIRGYLKKRRVPALVKVHTDENVFEGARRLIKSYGFGPIVPNTVLLGETEQPEHLDEYVKLISLISKTRRNLVIVRESEKQPSVFSGRRIDIWWGRVSQNAWLMLALAYLLKTSPEWGGSKLVLKTIVDSEEDRDEAMKGLQAFVTRGRLEAEVKVLVRDEAGRFDAIRESSTGESLIFIGMRAPTPEESLDTYGQYYEELLAQTKELPPTAIVLAAEDLEFERIFES